MTLAFTEAEVQLLLAALRFPGHYGRLAGFGPDDPTSRPNLRRFGERWFGDYLCDWEDAYARLAAEGLLAEGEAVELTARGLEAAQSLERSDPIYRYEYNLFFSRARQSEAHRGFCQEVYGLDLGQHGLADVAQLQLLIKTLALSPGDRVLDLGCGNGQITAFLAEETGAHLTGLDISEEGISDAQELTCSRGSLSFLVGNMNALSLPERSFDAVVSVDTLYYAADLDLTLQQMIRLVAPGGRMGLFFSQWIWDDESLDMLQANGTWVARILFQEGLRFEAIPLREAEAAHWDKKLRALKERKEEFLSEGNEALYAYRLSEAQRYANWPRAWRTRFLYRVEV